MITVKRKSHRVAHLCFGAVAAALILRFATLGILSLTDNTESRYGLIAWEMLRSGDWVTPRLILHGETAPFLGKPPLYFWLTSAAYNLFGVSEWSARIANFLLGVFMVWATGAFSKKIWGQRVATVARIVLSSSIIFLVLSGAAVLDVALAAAVLAAMVSFALFVLGGCRKSWGLAFFISLGLGMLAKGPVALVLVGFAIYLWLVVTRNFGLLKRLPWSTGLIFFSAACVPWYLMCEAANPGFLDYFIIHENFLRYVTSEYGDRYGAGRKQPYGMVWLMLAGALMPWTLLLVASLRKNFLDGKLLEALRRHSWLTYMLLWGLAPAIFFTFARQLLFTYVFPGLPGLAIAAAVGLVAWAERDSAGLLKILRWHLWGAGILALGCVGVAVYLKIPNSIVYVAAMLAGAVLAVIYTALRTQGEDGAYIRTAGLGFCAAIIFAAALVVAYPGVDEEYSAKTILKAVQEKTGVAAPDVSFPFHEDSSAYYYAEAVMGGKVARIKETGDAALAKLLDEDKGTVYVAARKRWDRTPEALRARLSPVAETAHWQAFKAADKPK